MSLQRSSDSRTFNTDQPLMFYKIVALSFLFLTLILIAVIVFMTSKSVTITVTTKEHPIDIETTVYVGKDGVPDNIGGSVTSTQVTMTKTFFPSGNKKEEGIAKGTVTLTNESNRAQPLIATTRLLTEDGILFRLSKGVTVPANGSVDAEVYADEKGATGDIGPQKKFIIPGLNEARQKEVYASSEAHMEGGIRSVGVIALEDLSRAREEVRTLLEEKGKKAFINPDEQGVAYKLIEHTIQENVEVGDEVSEFTLAGKATVAAVYYEKSDIEKTADAALTKHIVDDVSLIRVTEAAPKVSLERLDTENNSAELVVYHSGIETLNPDSKQLDKILFFGKSKEEVRRYLLKLNNVYGVDVHFKPVWVDTVPYVPDHVQIIIKQVE